MTPTGSQSFRENYSSAARRDAPASTLRQLRKERVQRVSRQLRRVKRRRHEISESRRNTFRADPRYFVRSAAGQPLGEKRGRGNRRGTAAAKKSGFDDATRVHPHGETKKVTTDGIADFDGVGCTRKFAGVTRPAKVIENGVREHSSGLALPFLLNWFPRSVDHGMRARKMASRTSPAVPRSLTPPVFGERHAEAAFRGRSMEISRRTEGSSISRPTSTPRDSPLRRTAASMARSGKHRITISGSRAKRTAASGSRPELFPARFADQKATSSRFTMAPCYALCWQLPKFGATGFAFRAVTETSRRRCRRVSEQ
jgi:hypothetical protein